jgi:hypothetical protein
MDVTEMSARRRSRAPQFAIVNDLLEGWQPTAADAICAGRVRIDTGIDKRPMPPTTFVALVGRTGGFKSSATDTAKASSAAAFGRRFLPLPNNAIARRPNPQEQVALTMPALSGDARGEASR